MPSQHAADLSVLKRFQHTAGEEKPGLLALGPPRALLQFFYLQPNLPSGTNKVYLPYLTLPYLNYYSTQKMRDIVMKDVNLKAEQKAACL